MTEAELGGRHDDRDLGRPLGEGVMITKGPGGVVTEEVVDRYDLVDVHPLPANGGGEVTPLSLTGVEVGDMGPLLD